ncbi:uncharacterized protein [Dysidea avara]|uniref:uncharacterized protein isoform X2 n=1 Tax=Dysidea avara TaxID=196820 RepID=UPI003329760A
MMEHQMIKQLLVVTTRLLVEDVDLPILSLICVLDMFLRAQTQIPSRYSLTSDNSPPRSSGGSVTSVTYTQHHISTSSSTTNSTPLLSSVTVTTSLTSNSITMTSCVGQDTCEPKTGINLLKPKYDDIVQSLPSDYEKTLQVVQDHLTDDQICDVLTTPNYTIANKTILNCLMEKVKCEGDVLEFCNHLEKITSLLACPGSLLETATELRTACSTQQPVSIVGILPQKIATNKEFAQLKTHYHTILQLMPDNYEQSVGKLQNYFSDDQICMILSSSNSTTANKIILDCLIERMSCREELLDLCDQLETISTSHQLMMVISEIRSDAIKSVQTPFSTTTASQLNDQQCQSTSPSVNSKFYHSTFSKILLDPNSRVLEVLKKNFAKLCNCLPQDCMKTIDRVKELNVVSHDALQRLREINDQTTVNEWIMSVLMVYIKSDVDVLIFCDRMDQLVDCTASKLFIDSLKEEFLNSFNSPPITTTMSTTITASISLPGDGASSNQPTVIHLTPQQSSISTLSQGPVSVLSRHELQNQLTYDQDRLQKGIKCPLPPPLLPNYVPRQQLLDEMVTVLCHSTNDPNSCGTSLTVTGAGGFGKTSIVTALCHHPVIKEQFTDGVVFIELGPQATDPSMKLSQLYHLLTGQYLKQGDTNHAEQEINQLTNLYCRNLLVIIDDVWHVEDAEPIVKAFCNCKIVLTTRMNDVDQYIPTKQVVSVGPMEPSEARSLLTHEVINISQLSQDDINLLDELAQDVHLWPLLLSLVRGHLSHDLEHCHSSYHEAIHFVQAKLHDRGLIAFDKNNIENVEKSRKYAVKVCIEMSLELLNKAQITLSKKIKSLILWTGIGTSLQTGVLHNLWNVSEYEARDAVKMLWAYGLVQFTLITIPPHNNTQRCVEVHAVISQFILESTDSIEMGNLSPYNDLSTYMSVTEGLSILFQESYGVPDTTLLTPVEFLQYRLCEIENDLLPHRLQQICMITLVDPSIIITSLEQINMSVVASPNIASCLPSSSEKINTLINDCHKIIKIVHKLSRKVKQDVQRYLSQMEYSKLIHCIESYMIEYPVGLKAQQAASLVKKIITHSQGDLLDVFKQQHKELLRMTPEYHNITLLILPRIKLFTKEIQQINSALQVGSPNIEVTYQYYRSGKYQEEYISTTTLLAQATLKQLTKNCS